MLEIDNQTNISLEDTLLREIAQTLSPKRGVELLFVGKDSMQEINRKHRCQDKPTDVLSFPLDSMGIENILLGSVVICVPIAESAAVYYGHTLEEELALLLIHGILHLQGYDHEKDQGEHRKKEEYWIGFFNLPNSLITRSLENVE